MRSAIRAGNGGQPRADLGVALRATRSPVASLAQLLTEKRGTQPTKEREILDVAAVFFMKHGYPATSVSAMARSSGISKESIYRYFSSKRELFEAVIERELGEYGELLKWRVASLDLMDLRSALTTFATMVLGVCTADRTLALQRLVFEETVHSPSIGRRYHRMGPVQTYSALKRLFMARTLDSEFDAAALSRHLLALLSWRIVLERDCAVRAAPSRSEMTNLAASTVHDFMKAFLKPEGQAPTQSS
jgi:AcrR family transcriptional regulator